MAATRKRRPWTKIAAVAATYEQRKPGRQITPWHPRAAPKDRERWTFAVQENLRTAQPIIPAYFLNGPPTIQRVTTTYQGASQETIAAHYAAAMMEYQVFNTAFWDVVEPSLQFEGAYKSMDRLQLKEFMNDDLRDGVSGLLLFSPESGVDFSHTHSCAFVCILMHFQHFHCIPFEYILHMLHGIAYSCIFTHSCKLHSGMMHFLAFIRIFNVAFQCIWYKVHSICILMHPM